jgi:3-oxoacyl-[acyl-carrier protein] reductase
MKGKVALVTGGAGGIGSAICTRLAQAGASVVVGYRNSASKAQTLVEGLTGGPHSVMQVDVTDSASLTRLAGKIEAHFGRLDVLVNCHGVTTFVAHHDLDSLSDEWIERIFSTNWRGSFACVRALKPLLLTTAQNNGETSVIVNISSVAGVTGMGSNVAYCASKAALDSMTRSLGRALAPHIRVMSVSPGLVLGEYAAKADPAFVKAQTDATPLKKLAVPDNVADAVLAVCTMLKSSTGNIVPVDGGRPLGA